MRCLIIPRLIDKSAVAPKYHEGYTADINLINVPICDYDSLLSAMSAVFYYDPTKLGHKILTSYGVDLCRRGYRYVSEWLRPDDYIDIARYHSFGKELINSMYGSSAQYVDTDSIMIRRDDYE